MRARTALVAAVLAAALGGCSSNHGGAVSTRYTTVPDVAPSYPGAAVRSLHTADLVAVIPTLPPVLRGGPGGNGYAVRSQSPAPGSRVPAGTAVTLRLAYSANGGGPWTFAKRLTVPDVRGRPVETAYRLAADAGLLVTLRAGGLPLHEMDVRSQSRPAGETVETGTEILLVLE
jgi:beta-lactam-binding protein with PASTA domain